MGGGSKPTYLMTSTGISGRSASKQRFERKQTKMNLWFPESNRHNKKILTEFDPFETLSQNIG